MQISTSVGVVQAMIASFEFALPSIYQFLGPDQGYPARTGVRGLTSRSAVAASPRRSSQKARDADDQLDLVLTYLRHSGGMDATARVHRGVASEVRAAVYLAVNTVAASRSLQDIRWDATALTLTTA
jgi:hypothetical protein